MRARRRGLSWIEALPARYTARRSIINLSGSTVRSMETFMPNEFEQLRAALLAKLQSSKKHEVLAAAKAVLGAGDFDELEWQDLAAALQRYEAKQGDTAPSDAPAAA